MVGTTRLWEILAAQGSNTKAEAYQVTIAWAIEKFFPLKTAKRKDRDAPCMNKNVLRQIRQGKSLYHMVAEEGIRTV